MLYEIAGRVNNISDPFFSSTLRSQTLIAKVEGCVDRGGVSQMNFIEIRNEISLGFWETGKLPTYPSPKSTFCPT